MKNKVRSILMLSILLISGIASQAQVRLAPPRPEMTKPFGLLTKERQTIRDFSDKELSPEMISNILWAAYGINRPTEGLRTVPSARNAQEFDIYVFTQKGVFLYNGEKHALETVLKEDHRKDISIQSFFGVAPMSIVIVANYDRMEKFSDEDREFYSAVDAGYVSQQIYLMAANYHLATVACGAINRNDLAKLLHVKNGKVILAHPIGYIKE